MQSAIEFVDEHGSILGDDPFALEDIGERLGSIDGEQAAKSALDAALHDLQGKLLGVPAFKLLGLPRAGPPTSWTVWLGDPDDMARRALRRRARPTEDSSSSSAAATDSTSNGCAPFAGPPTSR